MKTADLFTDTSSYAGDYEQLSEAAVLLRGYALRNETALLNELHGIIKQADLRRMETPGGYRMSVAMTNCGDYGWVTDRQGYRYDRKDPLSGKPWPAMPQVFRKLASDAAAIAGFHYFTPDVCLINQYSPGAKMGLHQDKDERDFSQPIVSVSLGVPARFLFGGFRRKDKPVKVPLRHGDVLVWGGVDRLRYHGVMPLQAGENPVFGAARINLTFRRAA